MPVTASTGAAFRGALIAPGAVAQMPWPDTSDRDLVSVDASLVREIAAAATLTAQAASGSLAGRPAVGPLLPPPPRPGEAMWPLSRPPRTGLIS